MGINKKIKSILNSYVESGELAAVVYNSPTKANVELDTTAHPVAVLYIFRDGEIDLSNGTYSEIADINVLFLTHQDQLDFDASQNDALLDSMADVAKQFIGDLIASNSGDIVDDNVTVRGIYDFDDKNTTGVSLQFRFRSNPQCLSI